MHRLWAQKHRVREMKHFLYIIVIAVTLTGCSAQKRAERHMRKAVALCPELVQMTAHPIDTVLTAPGFADACGVPLDKVLKGDTLYAATDHGTVVVSLSQSDSSLRVGFVAAPRKIRYQDSVKLPQVVVTAKQEEKGHFWQDFFLWLSGIVLGAALYVWVIKK